MHFLFAVHLCPWRTPLVQILVNVSTTTILNQILGFVSDRTCIPSTARTQRISRLFVRWLDSRLRVSCEGRYQLLDVACAEIENILRPRQAFNAFVSIEFHFLLNFPGLKLLFAFYFLWLRYLPFYFVLLLQLSRCVSLPFHFNISILTSPFSSWLARRSFRSFFLPLRRLPSNFVSFDWIPINKFFFAPDPHSRLIFYQHLSALLIVLKSLCFFPSFWPSNHPGFSRFLIQPDIFRLKFFRIPKTYSFLNLHFLSTRPTLFDFFHFFFPWNSQGIEMFFLLISGVIHQGLHLSQHHHHHHRHRHHRRYSLQRTKWKFLRPYDCVRFLWRFVITQFISAKRI